MEKRASEIAVGDILVFVQEGKRAEDDIEYCYEVTSVTEAVGGPVFNPQPIIHIIAVEVETDHPMNFDYHPEHKQWVR